MTEAMFGEVSSCVGLSGCMAVHLLFWSSGS